MAEYKDLSLPPLMSTPKSQLSAEQPLKEKKKKKPRTYQKRSSTTEDIKKGPRDG